SSRRRHTRFSRDWSSDVCSSDLIQFIVTRRVAIDHAMTTLVWSGLVGAIGTTALLPFYWDSIVVIMKQLSAFEWLILSSTGFWEIGRASCRERVLTSVRALSIRA